MMSRNQDTRGAWLLGAALTFLAAAAAFRTVRVLPDHRVGQAIG